MISEKDLSRCIDILAELNSNADTYSRKLLLEVGYILKQELDTVKVWNRSIEGARKRGLGISDFDVKKLLEDNVQLNREKDKLLESNQQLIQTLESLIPQIENKMNSIGSKVTQLNKNLSNL